MPARIALFFPSLQYGGVQRFMLNLAQGLQAQHHPVDFVLVQAAGPMLKQVPPGARVIDLGAASAARAIPALARYLKNEKPGALLAAQTHINVAAVIARRLAGAPTRIVVSERSNLSAAVQNSDKAADRLRPLMVKLFYPLADGITANSAELAADLAKRTGISPAKIRVIYNPVDAGRIQEQARGAVSHPWLAAGQPPVLAAVGRLVAQKDFATLLRAFARARAQREMRLLVLGEGAERGRLEALARELGIAGDTAMPGAVENPFAWVARAAVFVLSSCCEGFPNVLLEALACGAPVVSTACPSGPSEILEGGRYGKLAPVGDAAALAEAILTTLDDPLPAATLRARAAEFSVERAAKAYLEALLG